MAKPKPKKEDIKNNALPSVVTLHGKPQLYSMWES